MSGNEFSMRICHWLPNLHSSSKTCTLLTHVSGCWRKMVSDKHFCRKTFFVNTPKNVSAKYPFWRSCAGVHVTGKCSSKIHCQTCRFQTSTTLGRGVRNAKTVFRLSFDLKELIPSPFRNMILWCNDLMIVWYYDNMISWSYDTMIVWYCRTMTLATIPS